MRPQIFEALSASDQRDIVCMLAELLHAAEATEAQPDIAGVTKCVDAEVAGVNLGHAGGRRLA